jgi:DNA-binding transcriptional ArsR family regulator
MGGPSVREGANLIIEKNLFHVGATEMRVELDKKSLFALASDTRLEILRSLQPMRRTVSQLSESLNIDKAAVFRHLKKMEEGGLVKRYEDHGFVYYGLSWKARDLLSPSENTRIVVLLSASWILTIITAFFLVAALTTGPSELIFGSDSYGPRDGGTIPSEYANMSADGESPVYEHFVESVTEDPVAWAIWGIPLACCAILAGVFAARSYGSMRKPRQPSNTREDLPSNPDSGED